jgi:hypothetical protein
VYLQVHRLSDADLLEVLSYLEHQIIGKELDLVYPLQPHPQVPDDDV